MGDWCGSVMGRRHAIENRDAYRLGYPSGRCYWEHDLKKIVLNVTLPIDTGRLMGGAQSGGPQVGPGLLLHFTGSSALSGGEGLRMSE